jgi:hypothetical protein
VWELGECIETGETPAAAAAMSRGMCQFPEGLCRLCCWTMAVDVAGIEFCETLVVVNAAYRSRGSYPSCSSKAASPAWPALKSNVMAAGVSRVRKAEEEESRRAGWVKKGTGDAR